LLVGDQKDVSPNPSEIQKERLVIGLFINSLGHPSQSILNSKKYLFVIIDRAFTVQPWYNVQLTIV
jgi:hypothetical protein